MQGEIKKNFKRKTIKFYWHTETEGSKEVIVGHAYCPWCGERRDARSYATAKKAAKAAFTAIETHWKISHQEK